MNGTMHRLSTICFTVMLLVPITMVNTARSSQDDLPGAGDQNLGEKGRPWPTKTWATSSPAEQKLNGEILGELVSLIRVGKRYPDLHSLLVVRNSHLVVEEYFGKRGADDLHTLQSVTKSFASAAVGIAIANKDLEGVEERVLSFFEDLEGIDNIDERKKRMVIRDLLTMRSGTDYHERGPNSPSPHRELNMLSRGWTEFVLSRPMVSDPGTRFQYDSGGVILLSSILKATTGRHADAYLAEHLFKPLGITRIRWYRNAEGHPHTGGGLMLTSRDMAKFGLLYLRNGVWDGKQVVPAEWVRESTRRHSDPPPAYGPFSGYGYLWWILKPPQTGGGKDGSPAAAVRAYAACGFMAQYIIVVPGHDMVVVVTGGTRNAADQGKPFEFLYSHILPSVVGG